MGNITPRTSLPANGVTSGAVQITGTALRVSARSTDGDVTLALIRMNSTGDWFRVTDEAGNQIQMNLTPGVEGNTDWNFTLPAEASNEYYHLLLDGGSTFTGDAEINSCSAPAAAGGTVPQGRALTMGSGLTIAGTSSADLSADRTIALDTAMWSIAASALTLAANYSYSGAAGTGGLALSSMTGNSAFPTGAFSWAGAANKNLSLVGTGTGTITIDNASTWSIGATAGTSGTIGRTGQTVTFPGTLAHTGLATFGAGITASGAVANDFSGSTATFLTSTGLNTIGGDLLMASGKVVGFGAPQALSGPGAVNVTTLVTLFTSTGAGDALTMADGTRAGQLKFVTMVVDGGSGVLTPTTKTNFTTLTLTAAHDWGLMQWSGSAWRPVAFGGTAAFA